jgi:hypothetical protein
LTAVLGSGCDEADLVDAADEPVVQAHDGEQDVPSPPGDEQVCEIGANRHDVVVRWEGAPSESGFEVVSKSGKIVAMIKNDSASTFAANVQVIASIGGTQTFLLPIKELPAEATVSLEFDLKQTNASQLALKAPGQLLVRVELNPGTAKSLIEWASPVYVHYDAQAESFLVYDAVTLKSKYKNGDLSGEVAALGGTLGAEVVLSAQ